MKELVRYYNQCGLISLKTIVVPIELTETKGPLKRAPCEYYEFLNEIPEAQQTWPQKT